MRNYREFSDAPKSEVPVRGFLHLPANSAKDCLVLTHGAGANCESLLLVALADAFCASGLTVLRCDLPFRQRDRTGHRNVTVRNVTNKDFERQLLPCDD